MPVVGFQCTTGPWDRLKHSVTLGRGHDICLVQIQSQVGRNPIPQYIFPDRENTVTLGRGHGKLRDPGSGSRKIVTLGRGHDQNSVTLGRGHDIKSRIGKIT